MKLVAAMIIGIVALFYAYGAAIHFLNILSLTGFDWTTAPLKWQVLDVVYLILDVLVVFGLVRGRKVGYVAFYLAALSQIVLYTLLKSWITDASPDFAVPDEQQSYLTALVVFHIFTLVLVTASVRIRSTAALLGPRNAGHIS